MNKFESLEPVEPVRTLAPYIGGKRSLSGCLVEQIEATPTIFMRSPS